MAAYLTKLEAEGTCADHQKNVRRCLRRITGDCRLAKLVDYNRDALKKWLAAQKRAGIGARTRNAYRGAMVAFCNWCVETDRLEVNPLAKVKKANEKVDCRRQRRAMSEHELRQLLYVATWRPLADYGRLPLRKLKSQIKRSRDTWKIATLALDDLPAAVERARERPQKNPAFVGKLLQRGRQRALVYKVLVLTGLRKAELDSLTVAQLVLEGPVPFLELEPPDEKNREGSGIPLRGDLLEDLRRWLSHRLDELQRRHEASGGRTVPMTGLPTRLPADMLIFTVPRQLVTVLNQDLKLAGIAKTDERGRTLDVHALRHSFGTLLSVGGANPRTAQAAMRHSSIDLTMNTYTDPKLLDVQGAMELLPDLPLVDHPPEINQATGTHGGASLLAPTLAPVLAPKADKSSTAGSTVDKRPTDGAAQSEPEADDVSRTVVKQNKPLTLLVNGLREERETGFEPATSSLGS